MRFKVQGMATQSSTERGAHKMARNPVKIEPTAPKKKPSWISVEGGYPKEVEQLIERFKGAGLHTVCQEAACPNLGHCFSRGTASFMIMGDHCTRRCSFCNVAHGKPQPLDPEEPEQLARTVQAMRLRYVVVTSVDRDDLLDGGASHFTACVQRLRNLCPGITVELLVPDFRGRREAALDAMAQGLPDVFNHNIETVPRLYKKARPGADYQESLTLLEEFKKRYPGIPTKSGLMLGLGETMEEVQEVLSNLLAHGVEMLTVGQYLSPSKFHLPVDRYVTPQEFQELGEYAKAIGFKRVASGPMVRSSYHADLQAAGHFSA
jgi:lipoic acid synthetase